MCIASICPIPSDGYELLNLGWFDTVKMLDLRSEGESPSLPST